MILNIWQCVAVLFTAAIFSAGSPFAQPAQDKQNPANLRPLSVMGSGYDVEMNAKPILLGEQTVNGITAMAHISDIGAMMAKMGRKENSHFMVRFTDMSTGTAMTPGAAVLKIIDAQQAQFGETLELVGTDELFEAIVFVPAQGKVTLQVEYSAPNRQPLHFPFQLKR